MKKSISLVLAASMGLTACSESNYYTVTKVVEPAKVENEVVASNLNLEFLFSGDFANLSLAEDLNYWMSPKKDSVSLTGPLFSEEKSLALDLQKFLTQSRYQVLASKSSLLLEDDQWNRTAMVQRAGMEKSGAFSARIHLELVTKASNESLGKILEVYNRQMKRNVQFVAKDIIASPENAELVKHIDAVIPRSVQEMARDILPHLKKFDNRLATYELPQEDNVRLLIYSAVALELAYVLKDNSSVKAIVHSVGQVVQVGRKAQEVLVLVRSMDEYRQTLKQSWNEMGTSLSGMVALLRDYEMSVENLKLSEATRNGLVQVMHDSLKGRNLKDIKGASFLGAEYPLNERVNSLINSTAKAADSVSLMVNAFDKVSGVLNIPLSPEVRKAMDTARKVNSYIQVGKAVANAFSAGGVVGALGTFAGGGPVGVAMLAGGLGGDSGNEQILSELREMKEDVRYIRQSVDQIIEMQKTTLEILKEISVMVDRNHKEVMNTLADLTEEVRINREMIYKNAAKDLGHCMQSLALRGLSEELDIESYKRNLGNIHSAGPALLNTSYQNSCSMAMSQAFGIEVSDMTKYQYVVANDNQSTLNKERYLYATALSFFKSRVQGLNWERMSLHLPMATNEDVQNIKSRYTFMGRYERDSSKEIERLLSAESVEMFSIALLQTHSTLAIQDTVLRDGTQEEVEVMLQASTRLSRGLLTKALKKVNMSIAQVAIMSGEPLLPVLNREWDRIVDSESDCNAKPGAEYCFILKNPTMLANLLRYRAGTEALKLEDVNPDWAALLKVRADRIILKEGKSHLRFGGKSENPLTVSLDKVFAKKDGMVEYDGSLNRLLELQSLLADELVKVSPLHITGDLKQLLKTHIVK